MENLEFQNSSEMVKQGKDRVDSNCDLDGNIHGSSQKVYIILVH